MATIWIVEDDPNISRLIEISVTKVGHQTKCFADAEELDLELKNRAVLPDLMLLDLMLRAKSGFDVLKEWKAGLRTRAIPIIIISARSVERDKVMGLELGAEDYITKPFGVRELQARVQTALRRLKPEPERLAIGDLTLFPESRGTFVNGVRVDLTAMEFDLLYYLACRQGQTVSRAALLRDVWGYIGDGDTTRTVDSHIKTLRSKLKDNAGKPHLIETVRGTGYRFSSEDPGRCDTVPVDQE